MTISIWNADKVIAALGVTSEGFIRDFAKAKNWSDEKYEELLNDKWKYWGYLKDIKSFCLEYFGSNAEFKKYIIEKYF